MNAPVQKYQAKRSDSVVTAEIRWAYPWLHEKSTKRGNGQLRKTPIWVVTGMLPKLHNDPTQCANYMWIYNLGLQAAAREPLWGHTLPQGSHIPIQDGDAPPKPKPPMPGQAAAPVDPNKGAWRRGHWLFEATTSLDPGPRVAMMQNGQMVDVPARVFMGNELYKSGDYGYGSIHAFTFQNEKWGFNIGLEGILWTRQGERIGNSSGPKSATSMFGTVAGVHAAQPGTVPPPPVTQSPPTAPQQYAPQPSMAPQVQGYAQPAPLPPQPTTAMAAPLPPMAPPAAPVAPGQVGLPPLPPVPGR